MRRLLFPIVWVPLAGCTFIMGDHNAIERQGSCGNVVASSCDAGESEAHNTHDKASSEGDKARSTSLSPAKLQVPSQPKD